MIFIRAIKEVTLASCIVLRAMIDLGTKHEVLLGRLFSIIILGDIILSDNYKQESTA